MSDHTADDAFHEIQFSGKQLFFLFMAASVVSVVIFLCGVLVGRGVQAERRVASETEALAASPSADVQPQAALSPTAASAGADLAIVPPPPVADDPTIVQKNSALSEPRPDRRNKASRDDKLPATPNAAKEAVPVPKAFPGAAVPTKGQGSDVWVVQVAALNTRNEADALAKNLIAKGHGAYVMPPSGRVTMYRVRVGGFKTRREADSAAEKLRKEGQKPWVTTR